MNVTDSCINESKINCSNYIIYSVDKYVFHGTNKCRVGRPRRLDMLVDYWDAFQWYPSG